MTGTVLVTGGSSPLGDIALPRIVEECVGGKVFAAARSVEAARRIGGCGATAVEYDFANAGSIDVQAKTLIHLAGIRFASELVTLARQCQAERVIVISSASAVAEGHPNRGAVLAGERLLSEKGFGVAILRPTMIYGSFRERNVRRLADVCARLPAVPRVTGGGLVMPVLADDVTSAVLETLGTANDQPPRAVGGPTPLRLGDIVEGIARADNLRRIRLAIPVDWAVRGTNLFGAHQSKFIHAIQMLGVDRVVDSPEEAGFEYQPTEFSQGIEVALRRYRNGSAANA